MEFREGAFDFQTSQQNRNNDYIPTEKAILKVRDWFVNVIDENDIKFTNGRLVRNFFDDVIISQSKRLAAEKGNITKEQLIKILASDIPDAKMGSIGTLRN